MGANGGGIWNVGNLTVTNCIIRGNRAGSGGGIFNAVGNAESPATLVLDGCTITGNTAHRELPDRGRGGGVFNAGTQAGTLTRINTTISGNTSDEGPDCDGAGC